MVAICCRRCVRRVDSRTPPSTSGSSDPLGSSAREEVRHDAGRLAAGPVRPDRRRGRSVTQELHPRSSATTVARRPVMVMPPPGPRSRSGARWSSALRKPVFQKMVSSGRSGREPSRHRTPSGMISSKIASRRGSRRPPRRRWRASGADRSPRRPRSVGARRGPVVRRGRRLRDPLRAEGRSEKTGSRRLHQNVVASVCRTGDLDQQLDRGGCPHRRPALAHRRSPGAGVVVGVQLAAGERVDAGHVRDERPVPGPGRIDDGPRPDGARPSADTAAMRKSGPSRRTARTWTGRRTGESEPLLVSAK